MSAAICSPAYALAVALWGRSPAFADADKIVAAAEKAGVTIRHVSGREETIRKSLDSLGDRLAAIAIEAAEPLRREAGSTRKGESAGLEEASPDTSSQTPAPKE